MIHCLTCDCGHIIDVEDDLNEAGRAMLKRRGPPRCFGCHGARMHEAWISESLVDDEAPGE